MRRWQWLGFMVLMVMAMASSACAPSLQADQLGEVKRVAIIGFSVVPEGEAGSANLVEVVENAQGTSGHEQAALDGCAIMAGALRELGWQVMGCGEVATNPTYKQLFKDNSSEFWTGLSKLSGGMHPAGILWGDQADDLSKTERDALMDALGVDALALASITVTGTALIKGPVGAEDYDANLVFRVYSRKSDDPIWCDQHASGDTAGLTLTFQVEGVKLRENTTPRFLEAVASSFQDLIDRYVEEGGPKASPSAPTTAAEPPRELPADAPTGAQVATDGEAATDGATDDAGAGDAAPADGGEGGDGVE